jgi:hypothetical protein
MRYFSSRSVVVFVPLTPSIPGCDLTPLRCLPCMRTCSHGSLAEHLGSGFHRKSLVQMSVCFCRQFV